MYKIFSSEKAQEQWSEILDAVIAGKDVVIEHNSEPTVVLIPYEDFLKLGEILEEIRDVREAQVVWEEWQQDKSSARPWQEVKKDLIADGLLDE